MSVGNVVRDDENMPLLMMVQIQGELGVENRILSLFKRNPGVSDKELMKKSGVSKGTFYRYKKILQSKGLI